MHIWLLWMTTFHHKFKRRIQDVKLSFIGLPIMKLMVIMKKVYYSIEIMLYTLYQIPNKIKVINLRLTNEEKTSKTAFPVGELDWFLLAPINSSPRPEVPNLTKLLPRLCLWLASTTMSHPQWWFNTFAYTMKNTASVH